MSFSLRLRTFAVAALVAAGCVDADGPTPAEGIALPEVAGISLPAMTESYALDFGIEIEGAAVRHPGVVNPIGAISVWGGAGTVDIDGTSETVALHARHPWPAYDLTLYQGLVIQPDRMLLVWFYCRDGSLVAIYHEGTDGTPLAHQSATGRCDVVPAETVIVDRPALDMAIPPLVDGFSIEGPDVFLDGAEPGWLRVGGRKMELYPFQHVDCTTCGAPGWHELHVLLRDGQRVHIACLYLHPGGSVQLVTWWSLPSPALGISSIMPGSWRVR